MSDVTANLTCGAVHCIILQPWKGIIIPREFQKRHRVFPLSRKQTTDCECINSRHLRAESSIENIESFAVLRPTRTPAFKKSSQFPIIIKLSWFHLLPSPYSSPGCSIIPQQHSKIEDRGHAFFPVLLHTAGFGNLFSSGKKHIWIVKLGLDYLCFNLLLRKLRDLGDVGFCRKST